MDASYIHKFIFNYIWFKGTQKLNSEENYSQTKNKCFFIPQLEHLVQTNPDLPLFNWSYAAENHLGIYIILTLTNVLTIFHSCFW